MAKEIINQDTVKEIFKTTTHVLKLPHTKMWIDYDKEADVLYINFKRPQKATDSEMMENGILLRYRQDELVGVSVLDASKRN